MSSTGLFVFCVVFMVAEIAIIPHLYLGGSFALDQLYSSVIEPMPVAPTWGGTGSITDIVLGIGYFLACLFYVVQMLAWIIVQTGKLLYFVLGLAGEFAKICTQYPMLLIVNVPIFLFVIYALVTKFQVLGTGGTG